jgi:signal transduction histidine kinase
VANVAASVFSTYQAQDQDSLTRAIRRVEGQQGVRYVLLLNDANVVVYDSIGGERSLLGKTVTDTVSEQLTTVRDAVVAKVSRDGEWYYNYAFKITPANELGYTLRLGVEEQVVDGEFNRLAQLFLYLGGFGVIVGFLAAYFLTARLTKPIVALTESALAIRAGNLNAYPNIRTGDELEQLAREFQGMVEKLKQFYFQEYRQKKEALESKRRLEEINFRLQELDSQKTDFLNTASHQLRTPLSVIHWSLSMIVDDLGKMNVTSEQKELLEEALKSTKHMVDLVNSLLDIARIEQGRKELDWKLANYGTVADELVRSLQPLAEKKGIELTYHADTAIPDSYLDPQAFHEVINNFVDNCIKYTEKGYVHVSTRASMDAIEIIVEDSGIGMTEEEMGKLFTRFARGKDAAKLFANGSGLGMYVAHSILRQHQGSVTVQSEKGKGSTFILTVPILRQSPGTISGDANTADDRYSQVGATTAAAKDAVGTALAAFASNADTQSDHTDTTPADGTSAAG